MVEQVIDPAKPIMTFRDRQTILEGHAQTYARPDEKDTELMEYLNSYMGPDPEEPPGDLRDTNLLPFRPLTRTDLQRFMEWCGPLSSVGSDMEYSSKIGKSILKVTDAYIRQICLFVNSHSPVRNTRKDFATMAYLPHNFWDPPTNPPTEEYIEDRAEFIRTTARLPPSRLQALTHLFIHIVPSPSSTKVKPDSALMVITPRAATIEYFDQLDDTTRHFLIGDIMNVISRVDRDRHSTWLELGDWKCRAGASSGDLDTEYRPREKVRATQIHVCTTALGQAFGHDVNMFTGLVGGRYIDNRPAYDILNWRKAIVIAYDLHCGYFSNVIGDRHYKPRVKRMFGHRRHKEGDKKAWIDSARQRRNGSPWLHFSPQVYKRLLPRELAQWNAENIWRQLDEEELAELARERMEHPVRSGRYDQMPQGAELGEFGERMKWKRARVLRMWLEDRDVDGGRRVTRYHTPDESVGWQRAEESLGA
ncbi:hypothetical protein EYC84_002217 [Monilinia fructicola]|uniref:Uncharacterized protein n=1 Tax=Monilinia fructicola TaxID=38448 RepID=A0A5M9JK73_MONFR|nr:hypothetical protein EYC84_002217 [Monilinia fructicola]